jgi:hypothetical protein
VCRACFITWRCKSSTQPDGGEGLAEAKGYRCKAGSEGRRRQRHGPMYKNRIRRERRAIGQMTEKPISIKGVERKSGGRVLKVLELTSGGLRRAVGRCENTPESAAEGFVRTLIAPQKSAEGIVVREAAGDQATPVTKARTFSEWRVAKVEDGPKATENPGWLMAPTGLCSGPGG